MRRLVAMALVLAACSSSSTPPVAPEDAVQEVPLEGWLAVVAADDDHLWMTDRQQLATYDRSEQQWSVADLPRQGEEVDAIVGAPFDGGLAMLLAYCDGPCMRLRENLAGIMALVVDDDAVDRVPLRPALDRFGGIDVVRRGDAAVTFTTVSDGGQWFIDVKADAGAGLRADGQYLLVCAIPAGYVAIEVVRPGTEASIAPAFPAINAQPEEQDLIRALRVVAGPSLDELDPVRLSAGPTVALADRLQTGFSCLPDGLALLAPGAAWELRGSEWSPARVSFADGAMNHLVAADIVELPDGTVIAGLLARRDPDGTWTDHDHREQVAVMGDQVIVYRNPE